MMATMPSKPIPGAGWASWGDALDANIRAIGVELPAVQGSVAALANRVLAAETAVAQKATLSQLSSVATSGLYSDLQGVPQRTVVSTTSTTTRPTTDAAVVVAWHTPSPPTTLMQSRDYWVPTGI